VIKIDKSIYDPPEPGDGKRILVMRLWPRGVPKARVDLWVKELGVDRDVIRMWKSGALSWEELSQRYNESLKGKVGLLKALAEEARRGTITLLCSCRDPERCHRSLLKGAIEHLLTEG
jgi:uncharacterized protein YeaO (DUF488 family)